MNCCMKAKRFFLLLIAFLYFNTQYIAQGCSTCRAQIESADGSDLSVGNGINYGIYILMITPYIILFVLFRKKILGFLKDFKNIHQ